MIIKVLIPARDVPLESTVTKKSGQKELIIKDHITVYNADNTRQTIKAAGGSRFLVDDRCNINNAISGDTEVLWSVDALSLIHYLEEVLEGPHQ